MLTWTAPQRTLCGRGFNSTNGAISVSKKYLKNSNCIPAAADRRPLLLESGLKKWSPKYHLSHVCTRWHPLSPQGEALARHLSQWERHQLQSPNYREAPVPRTQVMLTAELLRPRKSSTGSPLLLRQKIQMWQMWCYTAKRTLKCLWRGSIFWAWTCTASYYYRVITQLHSEKKNNEMVRKRKRKKTWCENARRQHF